MHLFLILDEATAFADPDNEVLVQKAFEKLSKNKTVIMIAHRLSTITHADCIYVLENGQIVESGKHEELLKIKVFMNICGINIINLLNGKYKRRMKNND